MPREATCVDALADVGVRRLGLAVRAVGVAEVDDLEPVEDLQAEVEVVRAGLVAAGADRPRPEAGARAVRRRRCRTGRRRSPRRAATRRAARARSGTGADRTSPSRRAAGRAAPACPAGALAAAASIVLVPPPPRHLPRPRTAPTAHGSKRQRVARVRELLLPLDDRRRPARGRTRRSGSGGGTRRWSAPSAGTWRGSARSRRSSGASSVDLLGPTLDATGTRRCRRRRSRDLRVGGAGWPPCASAVRTRRRSGARRRPRRPTPAGRAAGRRPRPSRSSSCAPPSSLVDRPRPRQRRPVGGVDAVVGHVRAFGDRLGHGASTLRLGEAPSRAAPSRAALRASSVGAPSTVTMIRRPSRIAEATMHQPAFVVRPVLMPSAPGYSVEQVVGRRDAIWPLSAASVRRDRQLERRVAHQERGEAGHVVRRRELALGVEPGDVDGVRVGQPEGAGLLVHQLGELRLAAGDVDAPAAGRRRWR